jgi:hypothetical protein
MKALIGLKGTKLTALKWHQVHAWRLSQHGLSPRLNSQDVVGAVTRTCGIQAQVMSAAELALCTRVEGLSTQDIKSALWQDHTLVKTWAMRATLHVLATSDLPLYAAALNFRDFRNWPAKFASYGLGPAQHEAFLSAVPQVVGSEPMTREHLASAREKQTGIAHLRDVILSSSWGTLLKQSAICGDLCCGPNQGQHVTFVNPRTWIDEWPSIEPEQAVLEMIHRYLRVYGIHLLPLFDAYKIGTPPAREQLFESIYKRLIFRPQGWISAVILVNGSIQGVWQYTTQRSQTVVKVHPFCSPTVLIHKGIEAEVERLGDFFKTNVFLEYEHLSSTGL